MSTVKARCPGVPLVLYINGNGGLLECMRETGVDVIGLDWTVDIKNGRQRLGYSVGVQGNVDPALLFSSLSAITEEIQRVVRGAGRQGHILNLGHGVLARNPEEVVRHLFLFLFLMLQDLYLMINYLLISEYVHVNYGFDGNIFYPTIRRLDTMKEIFRQVMSATGTRHQKNRWTRDYQLIIPRYYMM